MRSPVSRTLLAASVALLTVALSTAAWTGCSMSAEDATSPPPDGERVDSSADTRVQVIDVNDDAGTTSPLCGEEQLCDPDVPAICTPLETDAGEETVDAALDAPDGSSAGSTVACRVVTRDNRLVSACAPAGKVAESQFCASDDECGPGLACVGPPEAGRCLRFCCKTWSSPPQPSDGGTQTHYCTPQPLAARPSQRVPVWVKLDNCTLLDDELQCPKDTTCTVVTNDGRTTCVPAGSGLDYASCTEEPCNRGYVCLGTAENRMCRKLCRESEGDSACPGGGYCQRVPTIPEGYGICAGGDAGM